MAKVAFVFPGQGSQFVGMGQDLAARFPEAKEVFAAADGALGEKLSAVCFQGPEDALKLTANTQPAILTASIAAQAVLAKRVPAPVFAAGHSLGEYSALVASGALSFTEAVRAVRVRGRLMQEAVPPGVGAMAAVLGLSSDAVKRICGEVADGQVLEPANYNSPEQTVIAGHAAAVERAKSPLKDAGARRVVPLAVSAPFHCALMEPVKAPLRDGLAAIAFKPPTSPVVTNVEAKPNSDPARVAALLIEQVTRPVRWVESVEEMCRGGVSRFVEVGPGKVLRGLIRQIAPQAEVLNAEDAESLENVLAALEGQ